MTSRRKTKNGLKEITESRTLAIVSGLSRMGDYTHELSLAVPRDDDEARS